MARGGTKRRDHGEMAIKRGPLVFQNGMSWPGLWAGVYDMLVERKGIIVCFCMKKSAFCDQASMADRHFVVQLLLRTAEQNLSSLMPGGTSYEMVKGLWGAASVLDSWVSICSRSSVCGGRALEMGAKWGQNSTR